MPAHATFAKATCTTNQIQTLMRLIREALSQFTEPYDRGLGKTPGKLHKIRLTGGEPTLNDDLIDYVKYARSLVDVVGMTTNGILLEPLLPGLKAAGLTNLNISLDAIDGDAFLRFSRRDGLHRVVASIRAARRLNFHPVKINAVAMSSTDIAGLARFAAWEGVHLRFIELMAIGEARPWQPQAYISATDIREHLSNAGIHLEERQDRDEPTSRVWSFPGIPVEEASVGFITTTSAPFCSTCDRLRLTSQGKLHTCLMDDQGHDLLEALNQGGEAAAVRRIQEAVRQKKPPEEFIRRGVMADIGG